jgi:hypothetical protein
MCFYGDCTSRTTKFSQLFPLQENSQNVPLVEATLQTLLRFLNWIPLGYIFETKLISTLIYKVLQMFSIYSVVYFTSINHSFFFAVLKCSNVQEYNVEMLNRNWYDMIFFVETHCPLSILK